MSAHEIPALTWRKSSASDSDDCVEVAIAEGMVLVRDSKNCHGGRLAFSANGWDAFLATVRQDITGPAV